MARSGHWLSTTSTTCPLDIVEVHKRWVMKLNNLEKDMEQNPCP